MKHGSHENLGYLLTRASSAWNQRLMELFRSKGFHDQKPSFGGIFVPLFDNDGLSVKEIAKLSKLTKQTTSIYVRELESLGYIKKKQNRTDKRSVKIFLTPKGKELKSIADICVRQVNTEFRKLLDAAEFRQLLVFLFKIIEVSVVDI